MIDHIRMLFTYLVHVVLQRHTWVDVSYDNCGGEIVLVEQQCRDCGAHRHRLVEEVPWEEPDWHWHSGPHPNRCGTDA